MKIGLWLFGALLVACGIILMASGGIGMDAGPTSLVYSQLGYDALPEIAFRPRGIASLACLAAGIGLLVFTNRDAWQQTGGY